MLVWWLKLKGGGGRISIVSLLLNVANFTLLNSLFYSLLLITRVVLNFLPCICFVHACLGMLWFGQFSNVSVAAVACFVLFGSVQL